MVNTGIYVRVSTEEQAQEGYSIRAQEQKLKDYARIKDWGVYNIYADEGISGKNIVERPAINSLIEDIKNGKVNNVLVFKIDRLTRNTADLITLINLFNEYDCAFNSLSESIDTKTASGRMFVKIIGIFAEFERENIIERTKIGFERKVREGYTLATRVPSYGYDRKIGEKIQTINEAEAIIVREVFDMFTNQHLSFLEISDILNERKIPTKENAVWHSRTIKNMLTNCNYVGKVRYATRDEKRHFETEGVHEPIISQELYEETQNLIKKIKTKSYTKRPKEENYFSGVLFCSKCGGRLVTHGSYRKNDKGEMIGSNSYRCSNYIKHTCQASNISHNRVERAFIDYINNIEDFTIIDEIEIEEKENLNNQKMNTLYKQKDTLEHRENEILNLYISGTMDFEHFIEIKNPLEQEKLRILSEIQELENSQIEDEEEQIIKADIIKNIKENWELLTDLEKRQFVVQFIDKIIVDGIKINQRSTAVKILDVKFNTM